MYISKELFVIILLAVIYTIHIILHVIEFIKLHNLKTKKPITLSTLKEKGKELITTLLKPDNSIISGIKEFIFNSIHTQKDEDDSDSNGGENG